LYLIQRPVLHLKDDKTKVVNIEKEIRFVVIDIGRVPGDIVRIRLRNLQEEQIELPLALGVKHLVINRDHKSHNKTSTVFLNDHFVTC